MTERGERLAPGATVGILGGGQLGRMLALAGLPWGLEFRFFEPHPEAVRVETQTATIGIRGTDFIVSAEAP